MTTIINILGSDNITDSRSVINTNFSNINLDKVETTTTINGKALNTNITLNKTDVGLSNVDNTSDVNKPVSTATQNALDGKVDKVSGKGLSTNDYDNTEKAKVDGAVQTIVAGTNVTVSRTGNSVTINSTGGGGGSSTLDGLTDVTITSPTNGQSLTYNTATSQWINSTPAGGGDMLKSVYDTNNDGIVNQADVITNQGDLATLDNVDTAQITNQAVTNTKLENMNANTVKGRLSGNGTPQDVAMADLPISTATQTALDGKVTGNSAITGATKTKITYDSKGLVTGGADLIESDIPTLAQSKITNLVTDLGNKQPLATVLTNTTASYTTTIDTRLANTSGTNTGDNATNSQYSGLATSKQDTLVSGTNIKTVNGSSLLGSGNLVISGGGSTPIRITIPGEQIADTSNYQGLYWYNNTGATITISNVAFAVGKAAAGSGAALAYNLYKSSGTASDGLNTNAVALFSSAVDLGTNYTSLTNVPNTTTVENGRWVTLRVTSSAGATSKASDAQVIITYS